MYPRASPGLVLLLVGCAGWEDPIPTPPARPDASAADTAIVVLESNANLQSAPRVPRFVVTPAPNEPMLPESLWLFTGELSSYYGTRLERGEVSSALLDRQVPTLAWDREGAIVLAPTEPLLPNERYTLAALGRGPLVSVLVAADAPAPLTRVWPPRGAVSGASYPVYCGQNAASAEVMDSVLEPYAVMVRAEAGADERGTGAERCVRLVPLAAIPEDRTLVPPAAIGSVLLDPSPLGSRPAAPVVPAACADGEVAFGPGCAVIEDDRVRLRAPAEPLLWIVRGPALPRIEVVPAGAGLNVTGLLPQSSAELELTTVDLAGTAQTAVLDLQTLPPRPHVVINEVLANSLGPEPAGEWIELLNTGTIEVNLEGWSLFDSSGVTSLPAAVLPVGAFALLVREDFPIEATADIPPAADAVLVRVARLGNGLSNSGETLRLEAPGALVVSRFPAIPQPEPGVSAIRRRPDAWDDDLTAFGLDPTGACSPGAPNPSPG